MGVGRFSYPAPCPITCAVQPRVLRAVESPRPRTPSCVILAELLNLSELRSLIYIMGMILTLNLRELLQGLKDVVLGKQRAGLTVRNAF